MSEFWFEEELCPTISAVEELRKAPKKIEGELPSDINTWARGIVRVDNPRWQKLDSNTTKHLLSKGHKSSFYLVRLGFQFDIPHHQSRLTHFVYARCMSKIWPATDTEPLPTVYDVMPKQLFEGKLSPMNVKLSPEIKLAKASASIGEISKNINFGMVEPVIVGFTGDNEQNPYWDLRPKTKRLLGTRHLWLILDVPEGCDGVRLAAGVLGDLQTKFGPIPVGSKSKEWSERPSIIIR